MINGWLLLSLVWLFGLVLLLAWGYRRLRGPSVEVARKLFYQQREYLEVRFFQAVASSGKPRGLRWKECEWEDAVEFARDRGTGQLVALTGVTISFEAVEGGDMEDVAAVGNLRNATAVFFLHQGRWQTAGRTVFNLNPDEVLARFHAQYERLEASTV